MSNDETIDAMLDNLKRAKGEASDDSGAAAQTVDNDSSLGRPDDALELARQETDRLYQEHGLNEWLDRSRLHVAVARWERKNGVCKYSRRLDGTSRFGKRMSSLPRAPGQHVVVVNERIVTESNDKDAFVDTVRHEVAHAIAYAKYNGSQDHNARWKRIASELGADPKACHNKKDDNYKYYIACPECEWTSGKVRRSKKVKKPFTRVCSRCKTNCVSYDAGEPIPEEPGTVAVESIPWDDASEWRAHPAKKLS